MANERLARLRKLMEEEGIDAYYVPSSDFHDSEYVEPYFGCRQFLSGFTGSAGTMVVTKDFSGLWTDGRYFVQAKKQLQGQDTKLMEMGSEGIPLIRRTIRMRMEILFCPMNLDMVLSWIRAGWETALQKMRLVMMDLPAQLCMRTRIITIFSYA